MYNSIIYIILIKIFNVDAYIVWRKCYGLTMHQCIIVVLQNVEGSLYGTKKLPCYNKVKLDC